MAILTLLSTLLPILLSLLGSANVITPGLAGVISKLGAVIPTLVQTLLAGGSASSAVLAVLQAVKDEVDAVKKANIGLTVNAGNEINALDSAISDAITAYQNGRLVCDPSLLTPLPEVL